MQYSLNEVTLLSSSKPTDINSRSEVNPFIDGKLPIFVSPMTCILNGDNFKTFKESKFIPILPRTIECQDWANDDWFALSLNEFEEMLIDCENNHEHTIEGYHILIDCANGHMKKIYDLVKKAKSRFNFTVMIGNIAHPDMYYYAAASGVDYVRAGIGGGNGCLSSCFTGIHTSHASLIPDLKARKGWIKQYIGDNIYGCNRIICDMLHEAKQQGIITLPKIIADGGIDTIDKAIKCLALGADYVMMGKMFAQCKEACGRVCSYQKYPFSPPYKQERLYYGMASEQGQKDLGKDVIQAPEGTEKWIPITTTLEKFGADFEAYLRSAMSYVGAHNLDEFCGGVRYEFQSIEEFNSYYKK